MCQFEIPRVLVTDNGKQFDNVQFYKFYVELGIRNHFSSPAHPQATCQVKVTNRTLLSIIKKRLENSKSLWPEELPSILWAYYTIIRTPIGEMSFLLVFGTEAVVPTEIEMATYRTTNFNSEKNEESLRNNLDMLEEKRDEATLRVAAYKQRMNKYYNLWVGTRRFAVGDLVLIKVSLET